jgi:lipoate-protein ligase A
MPQILRSFLPQDDRSFLPQDDSLGEELRIRLLITPPARGAWNMALDEALMESVRAGGEAVVRFYGWAPACLSLGRNQPAAGMYREDAIAAAGLDVVRRPTGGRAVLHDRELTYSVVTPAGLLGSPRESYARVNRALAAGVRRLGVPARIQPPRAGRAPVPSLAPCFRDPAEGEVVVEGRNLIGSAQYREGEVVLQHGSLLLEDDQRRVSDLLRERGPEEEAPAVLSSYLTPIPDSQVLIAALVEGWREEVPGAVVRSEPSPAELARAEALEARYADPAWTWRR